MSYIQNAFTAGAIKTMKAVMFSILISDIFVFPFALYPLDRDPLSISGRSRPAAVSFKSKVEKGKN